MGHPKLRRDHGENRIFLANAPNGTGSFFDTSSNCISTIDTDRNPGNEV
jgi:hypothetical protein